MNLPSAWNALNDSRREMLWNLAHKPLMTVTHYSLRMSHTRMLMALATDGLIRYSRESVSGGDGWVYAAAATSAGRTLVAAVELSVARETSRQLWAWLHSGPGLQTRPDF